MRPIIFFLLLLLFACRSQQQITNNPKTTDSLPTNSLQLSIEALNLSEDLSALSTKNDEILLFIYPYIDSLKLPEPIFKKSLVFDTLHNQYAFNVSKPNVLPEKALFVMLEQDSEISFDTIDSLFQINHHAITKLFQKRDGLKLERYLGDDDILEIKQLNNFNSLDSINFEVKGFMRADKYQYRIGIKK